MRRRKTCAGGSRLTSGVALAVALLLFPVGAAAQTPPAGGGSGIPSGIDPRADTLLRQMADYLDGLEQYSVTASLRIASILTSGQTVTVHGEGRLAARRPNRFRSATKTNHSDLEFFYDGRSITVFDSTTSHFAVTGAPATIDETLDFASDELGLDVPGSDLFTGDTYGALMEDVFDALSLGTAMVDGVECHHLAFRGKETDWEIWIQTGDRPLPREYLIHTKWLTGSPGFDVVFSDWDVSTRLPDAEFTFTPPEGAGEIVFGPPSAGTASQR